MENLKTDSNAHENTKSWQLAGQNLDNSKSFQTNRLKYLLLVPPDKRTAEQLEEIIEFVSEIKFLEEYRESDKFNQLCKQIYCKSYDAHTLLFEQGEEGDALYCILTGSVGIYIQNNNIEGPNKTSFMAVLGPGDVLGELSLLYGEKRSGTAITHEPSCLVILEKEVFDSAIKGLRNKTLEEDMAFFQSLPMFQTLKLTFLRRLVSKSVSRKYSTMNIVIKQGVQLSHVYFVKSGKLKIIRKIDFKIIKNNTNEPISKCLEDPTEMDYREGLVESKFMEIDELNVGEYFGDFSPSGNTPLPYTVLAMMPTELLVIDRVDLNNTDKEAVNYLAKFAKDYPPDKEYRKVHYKSQRWNAYKQALVEDLLREKAIKREPQNNKFRSKTPLQARGPPKFYVKDPYVYKKAINYQKLPPLNLVYQIKNPKMKDFLGRESLLQIP